MRTSFNVVQVDATTSIRLSPVGQPRRGSTSTRQFPNSVRPIGGRCRTTSRERLRFISRRSRLGSPRLEISNALTRLLPDYLARELRSCVSVRARTELG